MLLEHFNCTAILFADDLCDLFDLSAWVYMLPLGLSIVLSPGRLLDIKFFFHPLHRFVHSNQSFVIGRDKRDYKPLARSSVGVAIDELESAPRQAAENGLLSDAQLHCEAGRCLGCGTVVLNEDQCIGCGICTTKCKFDAIHLEKVNDTHGRGYFRTLLTVASNAPAAGRRFVRKKLQH